MLIPATEQIGELINGSTDLTTEGYQINNGNSFVMAVEFLDDGPNARAILTYGNSPNPDSPHYTDQTVLYTDQTLRPVNFTAEEIAADLVETLEVSRAAE